MAETRPIGEDDLHGYIDGQLEPGRAEQVEAYLAAQPGVAARVEAMARDRAALRDALKPAAELPVPPELRVTALRARLRLVLSLPRATAAAAALLIVGGASGWFLHGGAIDQDVARAETPMRDAVAAFRVFASDSSLPTSLTPETVTVAARAIAAQLGQAVPVPDLQAQGLSLVGGQVLATEMGPALLLIYQDPRASRLTMYVRPRPRHEGDGGERFDDGIATRFWFRDGLGFALSTDLPNANLLRVSALVR
jgi:anti-sigma factor RsiW